MRKGYGGGLIVVQRIARTQRLGRSRILGGILRRAHRLRKGREMSAIRRVVWVDTETLNQFGQIAPGNHTLSFGIAIYNRYENGSSSKVIEYDNTRFTDTADFWSWVADKIPVKTAVWIMAHNFNFDGAILKVATHLRELGFSLVKYINGKPPVIIRFRDSEGRVIVLVDTLNYFAMSLENLGKSVGMPKLDMPAAGAGYEEWNTYAYRDVEIIQQAFHQFRDMIITERLGSVQKTLASQAFTTYLTRFVPENLPIMIHDRQRFLDLERASYHGGRTEAFYRGEYHGELYKLDINSHYPAIMAQEHFAYEPLEWYGVKADMDTLLDAMARGYSVVARVLVNTDREAYGVYTRDKGLIFPVGFFRSVLTTPELKYALRHGHIEYVEEMATFKRGELFSDFVDYFYSKRQAYAGAGNTAFAYMCKILLNSLYGKFGQNGRKWEKADFEFPAGVDYYAPKGGEPVRVRRVLEQGQYFSLEGEAENSFPMIAAEITGYGRIRLWQYIDIIRASEGRVFYCDTDSLIVDAEGLAAMTPYLDDRKLGYLKLEEVSNGGVFIAPKHYTLNGKTKIKGIRANAVKRGNSYEQDKFISWDSLLVGGAADGYIPIERIVKRVSGENRKRLVIAENAFTEPIMLGG